MEVEQLSLIAGALLSLGFSYIPKLNVWYAKQESEIKSAIMAGLLVVVGLISYGLGCAGYGEALGLSITCDQAGFTSLVIVIIRALLANQAMYLISPATKAVQKAVDTRDTEKIEAEYVRTG